VAGILDTSRHEIGQAGAKTARERRDVGVFLDQGIAVLRHRMLRAQDAAASGNR